MGEEDALLPERGDVLREPLTPEFVPKPRMKLLKERLWLSAGEVSLDEINKKIHGKFT